MKYFSEQDIEDINKEREYKQKKIEEKKELCSKSRVQLIEDLFHFFEIFQNVVKEYPQIAAVKNIPAKCLYSKKGIIREKYELYF